MSIGTCSDYRSVPNAVGTVVRGRPPSWRSSCRSRAERVHRVTYGACSHTDAVRTASLIDPDFNSSNVKNKATSWQYHDDETKQQILSLPFFITLPETAAKLFESSRIVFEVGVPKRGARPRRNYQTKIARRASSKHVSVVNVSSWK